MIDPENIFSAVTHTSGLKMTKTYISVYFWAFAHVGLLFRIFLATVVNKMVRIFTFVSANLNRFKIYSDIILVCHIPYVYDSVDRLCISERCW